MQMTLFCVMGVRYLGNDELEHLLFHATVPLIWHGKIEGLV